MAIVNTSRLRQVPAICEGPHLKSRVTAVKEDRQSGDTDDCHPEDNDLVRCDGNPAQKVECLHRLGSGARYLQNRQALRNIPTETTDSNLHDVDAQCGQRQQNAHRRHNLRCLRGLRQTSENSHVEDES